MEHTIVISGNGQVSLLLVVKLLSVEQDSITTQLLESWHHPQSSDNKCDTDIHDEHVSAKPEQLYNITVENTKAYKHYYAMCRSYQLEGLHQSLDYI